MIWHSYSQDPRAACLTGLQQMELDGVLAFICLIMPKLNKENILLLYLSPSCLDSATTLLMMTQSHGELIKTVLCY